MSNDPTSIIQMSQTPSLGDRLRHIATQLRQESEVQIKATSRILGAAAQISQNHDHLIDEVVELVEEDLNQQLEQPKPVIYTSSQLQQQFKSLKEAKAYFGMKASSWAALATKLNESSSIPQPTESLAQETLVERLTSLEHEVKAIRSDINQALNLLIILSKKLS